MPTISTCPDATCGYRNAFGYCSQTACIKGNRIPQPVSTVRCDLCKFDLEDGDYLYHRTSSDHALIFEEIIVHYCHLCGRKL